MQNSKRGAGQLQLDSPSFSVVLRRAMGFCGLLALAGCHQLRLDPGMDSAKAGDYSLIHSACGTSPARGIDTCRFVEGAKNTEAWQIVLPTGGAMVSGEAKVRFKDKVRTYAMNGPVLTIPWRDITNHETWLGEDDGIAQVTGTLRFDDGVTNTHYVDILGLAFLVVLSPGYSPLPVDSADAEWGLTCKVQYTTAGRSSLSCQ